MRYAVTLSVSGWPVDGYVPCEQTADDILTACPFDLDQTEPGDSEHAYLWEENGSDPDDPFQHMWDATGSAILPDDEALTTFLDDTGLILEPCQTLGTIGGPANPAGLAPDVAFMHESSYAIVFCRITPLPNHDTPASYAHALRRLFAIAADPWSPKRASWLLAFAHLQRTGAFPSGPFHNLSEWELRHASRHTGFYLESLTTEEAAR